MSKKSAVLIAVLLFSGLIITEIPTLLRILFPETATIEYNLFIQKSYHEQITVLWYIYELGQILNRLIWAYAFCQLAKIISNKLFYIGVTFFVYQTFNFFFYIWDRNSSSLNNSILYCIVLIVIIEIIIPNKKTSKK